jgi:hypothetical protein
MDLKMDKKASQPNRVIRIPLEEKDYNIYVEDSSLFRSKIDFF